MTGSTSLKNHLANGNADNIGLIINLFSGFVAKVIIYFFFTKILFYIKKSGCFRTAFFRNFLFLFVFECCFGLCLVDLFFVLCLGL